MSKGFNLEDYDLVKDRIASYQDKHPDYRVETDVVFASKPNADTVIIKAYVYKNREDQLEGVPHATGIAEETKGDGYVNDSSHVENGETSAIGRALANVNFKISEKRPSRAEMEKVEREQKKKEQKEEQDKEDEEMVPEDEIEEEIMSKDTMPEVVKFFNSELGKRSGEEKKEFEEKYQPIANKRIEDIKGNG